MLRTRWFSSAISSSCRSRAVRRSSSAWSARRSTTSISVIRRESAMRRSASDQGSDWPCTVSFHASKLLRGVRRCPLGPASTGLSGLPAQVTVRSDSLRKKMM